MKLVVRLGLYLLCFVLGYVSHLFITERDSEHSKGAIEVPISAKGQFGTSEFIANSSDDSDKLRMLSEENARLRHLLNQRPNIANFPKELSKERSPSAENIRLSDETIKSIFPKHYVDLINKSEQDGALVGYLNQYLNEDIDYGWAPESEQYIQDYVQLSPDTEKVTDVLVTCKTSICQITFDNDDWQISGDLMKGLLEKADSPFKGMQISTANHNEKFINLVMISTTGSSRGFEFHSSH
ncbi:hypothetical protein ACMAZF_02560 [Psychrobium sp. nBUS_13]|uniref:hypothetical protein n=1 Tax=Psychrobium sp. nBUS_13 TaxID=3395319 RepID=UPI003EBD794F